MSADGIFKSSDLERRWDFAYPEKTADLFGEAFIQLKTSEKPDQSLMIELLTQIARAQGLAGKIGTAEDTLKQADALLGADGSQVSACARIRLLLEKGRIYCLLRTPARARSLFFDAWTLANQTEEHFHAVDAAQMMASIEAPKAKIDWTLKALAVAERSIDERAQSFLGALYSTLGWQAYEMHQYDKAKMLFDKALEHFQADLDLEVQEADATTIKKVLTARWAVGKTLRALGKVEDALKIQEELLGELQRSGSKSGDVCEELAECLTLLKRTSEAVVYFDVAYTELSKDEWVVDNMPARMRRLKSLGKSK